MASTLFQARKKTAHGAWDGPCWRRTRVKWLLVYTNVYMHMHTHAYNSIYTRTYTYVYIHIYIYVFIYLFIYIHIYIHLYTTTSMYTTCMYIYIYVCMYMWIHIYVNMYICVYLDVCIYSFCLSTYLCICSSVCIYIRPTTLHICVQLGYQAPIMLHMDDGVKCLHGRPSQNALDNPHPWEDPQFWTPRLLWCRFWNPKVDLLFGSAQGCGKEGVNGAGEPFDIIPPHGPAANQNCEEFQPRKQQLFGRAKCKGAGSSKSLRIRMQGN